MGFIYSWATEAIAYYCGAIIDNLYSDSYRTICTKPEDWVKAFGELSEKIQHTIDNYIDLSTKENYYSRFLEGYYYSIFFDYDVEQSHREKFEYQKINSNIFNVAFSDYLVTTYGKDKFVELYACGGSFYDTYGKYEWLIFDDYLEYLQDVFSSATN